MGSAPGTLVEFEEALRIVLSHASAAAGTRKWQTERLPLLQCRGRLLAEAVIADRDQPAFDRSTRDGFAVRAGGWASQGELRVIGQIKAGESWHLEAPGAGDAIEIMTGAPVPAGADSVVMVEQVSRDGDVIRNPGGRRLSAGENVVPRGSEARAGQEVLPAGVAVDAAAIALAATCGYPQLAVFTRPNVAIVSTGDELVEVADLPGPDQIRNSNSYALAALVDAAGGQPVRLEAARDTREAIADRVEQGRTADLLIFSGGVSMGEYDLTEEALTEAGAEFFFTGVKMQPGKPVVFGRLPAQGDQRDVYFFGLPGNPISTQVTFHCFAEPFLRALAGETHPVPRWAQATLSAPASGKPGLTRLLPARMDGIEIRLVGWQGSGDLAANARANCYAELLAGREYGPGEVVRVLLR